MIWILAIIGAIAGVVAAEIPGLIAGGLLGYLLGVVGVYRERISQLEKRVRNLEELQEGSASSRLSAKQADAKVTQESKSETQPQAESPVISNEPEKPVTIVKQSQIGINEQHEEEVASSDRDNPWIVDSSKSEYLSKPTLIDKLIKRVREYFTEGNLIVRVGVVVLFFGVSFLVKYSIDHALIPIELRLAGIFIGSIVMLAVGWHFRQKKPEYALVMQGGAVAIMYLTIFASYKIYHLMSAGYTFPLLIVFSILAMILAVLQNSRALAVIAITGGFVSPILVSTGSNDYVSLFSYYLVLNLSIFAVSWFKSWRLLNVIGFAFTFVIGTLWGVTSYRAENFTTTEPFLIAFFIIYVAISILFAIKQKPELKGYVDSTLVFGVPLVGFGLQAALVRNMEYGLAISAFVLGLFYLTVVKVLWNNSNSNFRLLCEAMLAIGVIFTTLTIPFALDGRWTAASWAIEGAGFVWVGLRQHRNIVVFFGAIIQLLGGGLYLLDYPYFSDAVVFINTEFLGTVIVSIAAIYSALLFSRIKIDQFEEIRPDIVFLVWGLCWWYLGGVMQIDKYIHGAYTISGYLAFFSVSALLGLVVAVRNRWKIFRFFPWLQVVPLCLFFFYSVERSYHIWDYGIFAWLFAITCSYIVLYTAAKNKYELFNETILHTVIYLLLVAVTCNELSWLLTEIELAESWRMIAIAAVIVSSIQFIIRFKSWPFSDVKIAYQMYAGLILMAVLLIWSIVANFMQFLPVSPLPYIPIINPFDIMQAIILITIFEWYRRTSKRYTFAIEREQLMRIAAGFLFAWFNVIMFKTLHVIDGVGYRPGALFESALVQTSVSISWTLIGLMVMVVASRKVRRQMWIIGAVLTGVVVAKLFLLDLSDRGTIERIVSFMVVGILLLIVGYFSPVPPAKSEAEV